MKKWLSAVLAFLMLTAMCAPSLAEETEDLTGAAPVTEYAVMPEESVPVPEPEVVVITDEYFSVPITMYVYTENGGTLNVRSQPAAGDNIVTRIPYGSAVTVLGIAGLDANWYVIACSQGAGGTAYVMRRFLVNFQPAPKSRSTEQPSPRQSQPTAKPTAKPSGSGSSLGENNRQKQLEKIDQQKAGYRAFEQPLTAAVRATRASGWINFRAEPGTASDRIATLPDGRELKLIGETADWYKAVDSESGLTGYISRNYVTVLSVPESEPVPEKSSLGSLTVNGSFTLRCALPEEYEMQVLNPLGSKIIASITSPNPEKPVLYLTVAYNEMYSDVAWLNDLNEADLRVLEESFTSMNDVDISYTETAYGTRLLVARETGDDSDFVDIMTVYAGYSIEFVMTPNPAASSQLLTDEQVAMCVDFLSELDFIAIE